MVKRFSRFFRGGFIAVICAALQSQVFAFPVQLIDSQFPNGTAVIESNQGEFSVSTYLSSGSIADLRATPNEGYVFEQWLISINLFDGSIETTIVKGNPYTIAYNDFTSKYGDRNILFVECEPIFKGKTIKVNLDANSLNAAVFPTVVDVIVGEKYTSLSNAYTEANGVSFVGWFTRSDGGTKVTLDTVVTETKEHTLYAHWQAKNSKLTFDAEHGVLYGSTNLIVIYGGVYSDFPIASRVGYDFLGWYTKQNGMGDQIKDGDNVLIEKDTTLYANWKPIEYTIAFDGNGATGGATSSIRATYDASNVLTSNGFVREYIISYDSNGGAPQGSATCAYQFKNWNTEKNGTGTVYENGATVTNLLSTKSTITLYAQWTATAIALPAITRAGFVFNGWYTEITSGTKIGMEGEDYTPTRDITLYAQWDGIEYELAFDNIFHLTEFAKNKNSAKLKTEGNGRLEILSGDGLLRLWGTRSDDSRIYTYYNRIALSNSGVYAFDVEGGEEYVVSVDVGSNLQKDPPARVYILFYDSDGEYIEPMDEYSEGGEALVKGNNRRTIIPPSYATKATIFFYASLTSEQYIEFSKIRVVKAARYFDQEIEVGLKYKYSENERYGKLPVPQRAGYEFSFWSYTEDDSGIIVDGATFVAPQSRTVYSHWNPVEYVVQLNSNEGNETNRVIRVLYESTYGDLPDATRDGYIFEGWYTEPSGGMIVTPSTKVQVAKDHVLYAHWINASYTVSFDPAGGEFVGGRYPISVTNGLTYPALPETTRTGYGFSGWYLPGDVEIKEGDTVSITNNSCAYAVWTNNVYTVIFRKGEAFYGEEFPTKVFYDIPFALPTNSFECLDGSTFAGWRLPDGLISPTNTIVSNLATSGSVEIVATWKKPKDSLNASGVCKNLYVTTDLDNGGHSLWSVYEQEKDVLRSGSLEGERVLDSFLYALVKSPGKITFKWCATGAKINGAIEIGKSNSRDLVKFDGNLGYGEWKTVSTNITQAMIDEYGGWLTWHAWGRGSDATLYIKDVVWIPDGYTENDESVTFTYEDNDGTERTASVPKSWVDENNLLPTGSEDYKAALEASSGKIGSNGAALPYWYDYVAGTDPNDPNDIFRITSISVTNGTIFLTWRPDLSSDALAREYKVLGKASLSDPDESWAPTNSASRFFRVDVHLKK